MSGSVRRGLELDELIERWTLVGEELDRARGKRGVNALAFGVLLKFFEIDGRFPEYAAKVPDAAVAYLGEQVKVDPALFAKYEFSSRTAKYHRSQIREVGVPRVHEG